MLKYIIKRLVLAVVTLAVIVTLTFFLMFLVPGGPFLAEKAPSPATLKALEAKFGLDKSVPEQFANYLGLLLKGDLGVSLKQRGMTINQIVFSRFPVSARIGGISVLVALLIGIPLGALCALKRGKWVDNVFRVLATGGISVPTFVVGVLLLYLFAINLKLLPTFGLETPAHYIMPVITLALYPAAHLTRLTRSSMLDVLGQDYMRTAKAKGLSATVSLYKHALRNALIPVIAYLGPMIAYTLTGSLVVERIFTIPGLGTSFITSITGRDYPLIMGTTIFLAALIITLNIIADVLSKIVDPRIQLK